MLQKDIHKNQGLIRAGKTYDKMRNPLAALVLILAISACASMPPSTAPLFNPAPAAPQGYATLYIFRGYIHNGMAVWPVTFLNDMKVADVKTDSYTYVYLWPGKYHLRTEKSQFLTAMDNMPYDLEIPSVGDYYLQFGSSSYSYTLPAGRTFVNVSDDSWGWALVPLNRALPILEKTRYLPAYVETLGHP